MLIALDCDAQAWGAFPAPALFSFVPKLESQWHEIHAEFLGIQDELQDYVEPQLYDQGWQVYGLWNLPHREPLPDVRRHRCPRTAALMTQWVPNHGAVAFSVLKPGARIKPHMGRAGPFLRCHLALEAPVGDCGIRVAHESRVWTAGRSLILDDRLEHEAWNRTSERRVVLLFDFVP